MILFSRFGYRKRHNFVRIQKYIKPVIGISAKYKYLNQHSVGKVVLKYNKYTIFNRFLTPSIKLLSITNLNELFQPG